MSISEPSVDFGVVLFNSTHGALAGERRLIAAKINHKLIPVPRHLSANCGFCIRFDWSDKARIEDLFGDGKLGVTAIERLGPPPGEISP